MGTTTNFLKLRSTDSAIKPGQWHNGFSAVKKYAESQKIPLVAVWSNGDKCGHCVNFEESAMNSTFKNWQKTSQCVFWFGYYGDTSKDDKFEGTGFKWCYNKGKVKQYPFVRVYWTAGKVDVTKTGDDLTGKNVKPAKGGQNLVASLKKILKGYNPDAVTPDTKPEPAEAYKIRFNENVTTKKVNAILDKIDACGGYCPCQPQSASSKCHCKDFIDNKGIGEVCICGIYIKQKA